MQEPNHVAASGSIPLDGRLERSRLSPLTTAIIALVSAFLLFQFVISPIVLLVALLARGISPAELLANMEQVLSEQAGAMLVANTVGQFLGIGLMAVLFARWHSSRPWAFLRVRATDAKAVIYASIGMAGLIPVTQFLGAVNESIPLPEWLSRMEQAQMELLERALLEETGFLFNLFVLAITPALCEELLFRGYVQRQAERTMGITGGILFSGIVFGLYHLRISHIIPLTVVGLYLAWVTWHFRSLWPAIVGHFLFNGFAVVVGAWAARNGSNLNDIDKMEVPWYLLLVGLVILGSVLFAMHRDGGANQYHEPYLTREHRPYE